MSLRRSFGAPRGRVWTPVRLTIHASSTPMRPAIAEFGTTSAGTQWPSPVIVATRCGFGVTPSRVASRAIERRSGGSVALRMGELRGLDLAAVRQDALAEAGEHLARADLDVAGHARLVQGEHGLAPPHGVHERLRELLAGVGERLGGHAGHDREAALVDLDVRERGLERLDGGLHQR